MFVFKYKCGFQERGRQAKLRGQNPRVGLVSLVLEPHLMIRRKRVSNLGFLHTKI